MCTEVEGVLSVNETENPQNEVGIEVLMKSLLELAVESWRFSKVFERIVMKLDAGENGNL